MKILIYGAGIIGSTYGWQLSKVGHDITILVRQGKKQQIDEYGINIHCSDFRNGQKKIDQVVFRPKVIEELTFGNDFEYIIIPINSLHLKEILPVLAKSAGKAHILFFQNIWDDFDEIAKYLSSEQYFFGFPFMVGGGKDNKSIYSAISGLKQSTTPLGELNGEVTLRIQKLAKVFEEANLRPKISQQIKVWLITHYAVAGALSAGIMKAGNGKTFAQDSDIIRATIKAIREGFNVCSSMGINPKAGKENKPYYFPLFFIIPILKKIYGSESLCMMFDGHTKHAPDEIKKMLEDIIEYGENNKIKMPFLKRLQKDIT
jgi:Ketopantoate reductase